MTAVILAHQGGWDEILMVLGPILVIVGLLRLAKKRVEERAISGDRAADPAGDPAAGPDDVTGATSTRG